MKQKNSLRYNILKKMLSKRVAVITDYSKLDHFYGEVCDILDEENVIVKNDAGEEFNVSIFNLRNPAQEL